MASFPKHSTLTGNELHKIYAWTYADETERLAASEFVATDIGHKAFQESDKSTWTLIKDTPAGWKKAEPSIHNILDSIPITNVIYTATKKPEEVSYNNGWKITIEYDVKDNPQYINYIDPEAALYERWLYTYNADNNIVSSTKV